MVERESNSKLNIKSLSDSILRILVPNFKQPPREIRWGEFSKNFTQSSRIFKLGNQSYGVDLTQLSEVVGFLRELVKARMEMDEKPEQWNNFLEKTNNLPDKFFNQPLGQFEDPNVRPITLSELNAILIEMLNRGIKFEFNEQ